MAAKGDLSGLCVITARIGGSLDGHREIARAAVEAGARMVQIREKAASTRELYRVAREIRELTAGTSTLFLVNDRVDVALAAEADGVHLGPDDLPWREARCLLGDDKVLGVSAATPVEVIEAEAAGADYLGVGPAYATGSKMDAGDAIGPEGIAAIVALTRLPVVAIGGIKASNAGPLWEAGAQGIAVISAVSEASDKVRAIRELKETRRFGEPR